MTVSANRIKHTLSVNQFDKNELKLIFDTAEKLEDVAKGKVTTKILRGAILANLFFEASTRTRMSFHAAFARLGGDISDTTGFSFSSISKGESLEDTAKVISEYADVIVMRHPEKGSVAKFAENATIPVINGGDGTGEHPTQALLDLYTISKEFKNIDRQIDNATITMTGDLKHGRTVHSLAKLLSLFSNITFHFVAPNSMQMPDEIIKALENKGHVVNKFTNPEEGIQNANVIYCTRMQKERFEDDNLHNDEQMFSIDQLIINQHAREDAIILHPLPRDTRPDAYDLSTDLDNDSRLKIFKQAANGIPIRMALFIIALGLEGEIGKDFTPSMWANTKQ